MSQHWDVAAADAIDNDPSINDGDRSQLYRWVVDFRTRLAAGQPIAPAPREEVSHAS